MKRCPECRRDYFDDSLLYCLDDGTALLEGPGDIHSISAPTAESATVMLQVSATPNEAPILFGMGAGSRPVIANAIAVLPFANLSREEDSEYLSDGLAEELLNVLSKISGLRVAARTSAFAFKGKQASVEEIGQALHVQSVLEGSVRMAGSRVRIAVQLVDVQNGYHLWSQTYDRTMDDIFTIQDDIAQSVVGELREKLIGRENDSSTRHTVAAEVANAAKGRAADPEAHRLMLMGRHLLDRRNEDSVVRAVAYFRQALDIDPDYALCWVEMGRALMLASSHAWLSLDADFENAEQALQRALSLEPALAQAHCRLGRIRSFRDGDFRATDRYIDRAMATAPDDPTVLISAAATARDAARFEKAMDYCGRATIIDPLNAGAWNTSFHISFFAGDLDKAEFEARRTLELAPEMVAVHASLSIVLLYQGRADNALSEALLEDSLWRHWALAIIHHTAGRSAESEQELGRLIEDFSIVSAFQIAEAHSMRGENDRAFEWLERAVDLRDPGRCTAKATPLLRPLHSDQRWLPLLKKIGFLEEDPSKT